ncbi:RNA polymerase sigma-70 factor [Puteibacter caeruleilacunae]|nr:RNA polymerase sigma-70 factor [Puteibacter caeruleilacunae]
MTDKMQHISGSTGGDEISLEKIFRRNFQRLYAFARKFTEDTEVAQDLVQEVFISYWEKKDTLDISNVDAFLYRSVRNKCISHIRHLKVVENRMKQFTDEQKFEEMYRIDFMGNEPCLLIEEELKNEISNIIDSLPERTRQIFLLSRNDGLKNREIADQLQISIKSVEKHITKVLKIFKERFRSDVPIALIIAVLKDLTF